MESRMGGCLSRGRGNCLEEESLGETEGEATCTRWNVKCSFPLSVIVVGVSIRFRYRSAYD